MPPPVRRYKPSSARLSLGPLPALWNKYVYPYVAPYSEWYFGVALLVVLIGLVLFMLARWSRVSRKERAAFAFTRAAMAVQKRSWKGALLQYEDTLRINNDENQLLKLVCVLTRVHCRMRIIRSISLTIASVLQHVCYAYDRFFFYLLINIALFGWSWYV